MIKKLIKKILGINNFSLFIKKNKKKILKKFYSKKFTAVELVRLMEEMGMRNGSIIFIHSSMTEFYNFQGNPKEIIDEIIKVIGNEGTLLMPAYPHNKSKIIRDLTKNYIKFDLNNTPSGAGYLTEIFRTYPGVKRSVNLQHSVCAVGKLADYFTNEHHLSETAWDEKSPYYKICQFDNSLVFTLGLPNMYGTIIHCVESLLKDEYVYFSQFFSKKIEYKYSNNEGTIGSHEYLTHEIQRKTETHLIFKKYFIKGSVKINKISNLEVKVIESKYTLNRLLELANKGITIFSEPSPKKHKNDKGEFTKVVL